ncbi:MAG TPA: tetratricopeptide repeat protein [Verrucomicrobiae bacterium]
MAFIFETAFVGLGGALFFIFWLVMMVDAVERKEWMWVVFLFLFPPINTVLYFFMVYRDGNSSLSKGFEFPGAYNRKHIKELQAKIHHLDNASHHSQLGDIYFQQGKLDKAEACYKAAMERDATDVDTRAHYGQCLLRLKRPAEALPLLEGVCREVPKHDFSHTRMALAETYVGLGRVTEAVREFEQVLQQNGYARAKVQLAELYIQTNRATDARNLLREALDEDVHAPSFQRKRDKVWMRQAKKLLAKV